MRIVVLFPVDSKKPGRGFKTEIFEVPHEVVREMFEVYRETRNVSRAVDVPCEWVAREAAKRWCRSMGRPKDEACIDEYLNKQGERIMQQCEPSARRWLVEAADCVKRCDKNRECLKECLRI